MVENVAEVVPLGTVQQRILLVRGEKVIIDADLAHFYGVPTRRLNEQVKRNRSRFPDDFMFPLTAEEKTEVIAKCDHLSRLRFSKALPYAFTEHGVVMAASVLNSERAIEVSVYVVRAFVTLRRGIAQHKELARKLSELEHRIGDHDVQIRAIVEALKQLLSPKHVPEKRRIGFNPGGP